MNIEPDEVVAQDVADDALELAGSSASAGATWTMPPWTAG